MTAKDTFAIFAASIRTKGMTFPAAKKLLSATSRYWVLPALLFLVPVTEAARANEPKAIGLGYEVYAGGFHALSFQARLRLSESAYQVDFSAWIDGFFGKFYSYTLNASVEGDAQRGSLRPIVFHAANRWQDDDEERVVMRFSSDGPLEVRYEPPEEDREVLPEAKLRGAIDPISGALAIVDGLAKSGDCEASVPVYDGKRRYDLVSRSLGEMFLKPSDYSIYSGPAMKCGVSLKRIVGFDDDDEKDRNREVEEIIVYLASVVEGVPRLPVRMESTSGLGALRVHLVAAQPIVPPGFTGRR